MPDTQKTWSQLLPETSQVMICDLQEQIVARSRTTTPDALSQSAEVLCQIAQLFKLPLTLSIVPEGNKAPKLIATLKALASEKNQFVRASATPFTDLPTREHLASAGRPILIIAGFATEVVVLHAAVEPQERKCSRSYRRFDSPDPKALRMCNLVWYSSLEERLNFNLVQVRLGVWEDSISSPRSVVLDGCPMFA